MIFLTISSLSSCESDDASNVDVFNEVSLESEFNSTVENSHETDMTESDTTEEVSTLPSLTPYEQLEKIISNTYIRDNLKYTFNATISMYETSLDLNSSYAKSNNCIYSIAELNSGESNIWKYDNIFKNGTAYITDKLIGKASFPCEKSDFISYIEQKSIFYMPLSYSTDISLENDLSFKYNFTELIASDNFYIELTNGLSIKKSIFKNGNCTIKFEDNLLKEVSGEILADSVFDNESHPFSINFSMEYSYLDSESPEVAQDYNVYNDYKSFIFSRSLYNLSSKDAYETQTETRIYFNKNGEKKYTDVLSHFSTSFIGERPMMSFEIVVENDYTYNKESFLYNGQYYDRSWITDEKKPNYITSDSDISYSGINSIQIWNPYPFTLADKSDISIEENDTFYIISYNLSEDGVEFVKTYLEYIKKCFESVNVLGEEVINFDKATVSSSIAKATIRKSDNIIIENEVEVLISLSDNSSINIILYSEVMAIDKDVTVNKPKK